MRAGISIEVLSRERLTPQVAPCPSGMVKRQHRYLRSAVAGCHPTSS
jgi:hypothetical protein